MGIEIERKFLLKDGVDLDSIKKLAPIEYRVNQGYLSDRTNVIRVRLMDDGKMDIPLGYLTIKGPKTGISCPEYEYNIPADEAAEMMALCGNMVIMKTRYLFPQLPTKLEVDVFHGRHQGLVIVEAELDAEDAEIILPDWVGRDVSVDFRYTNYWLSKQTELPEFH